MDQELQELESQLEKLSPKGMPTDMVARMVEAMDRWQDTVPAEEKIVPFQAVGSERAGAGRFNVWATAAAVTLMGAVGVVLMNPVGGDRSAVAKTTVPDVAEPSVDFLIGGNTGGGKNVVGVSNGAMDREVADDPTQKIVFDGKGRAHRLVRIDYKDKMTLTGKDGEQVTVEKPVVEYYLVPVQVE